MGCASIISTGCSIPRPISRRFATASRRPFYLVVEKILASHESLRADWPVEGTTGYDYANLALGVLVDPEAEPAFTQIYRAFAGGREDFETVARDGKLRIMENEMASELNALGRRAARLARQSPMTADLTRALLQRAIKQMVASFPVYRTYVDFVGPPAEADRRDVAWASARARRMRSGRPSVRLRFPSKRVDRRDRKAADPRAQPHRGASTRDDLAAILGAGDGQRRRGHRLLSL